MDETKETQTDSLPEGKAPEGSKGTTPTQKAYTQEELDAAIQADRIARGRDAKTLADREATLKAQADEIKATKAEIIELQKQIDDAELDAAKGDPAKLKELQAKKSYKTLLADLDTKRKELQKEREAFERDKTEHAETIRTAQETTMGMKVYEIAAEFELNPEDLKEDMKELNLTTEAQVKTYAKRISGKRPPGPTPVTVPTSGGRKTSSGDPLSNYFRDRNK